MFVSSLPGRVLVVEDDEQVRALIAYLLRQAGHVVTESSCAEEALDLLAVRAPDVVILDVHLPDREGHEVLRSIRSDTATRLVPVVMMTGEASRDEKLDARSRTA